MVREFPLLDGTALDLDYDLDGHPDINHDRSILIRQDYAEESLEWWESYETNSGPAAPTFDGFASDGTAITLSTGSGVGRECNRGADDPLIELDGDSGLCVGPERRHEQPAARDVIG